MKQPKIIARQAILWLLVLILAASGFAGCKKEAGEPGTDTVPITETAGTGEDPAPEPDPGYDAGITEFPDEDPDGAKLFDVFPRYSSKKGTLVTTNGGPGLSDDTVLTTPEDSVIKTLVNTTEEEFEAYVSLIPYRQLAHREDEAGAYYTYCVDGVYYDLSYTDIGGYVRLSQDPSTTILFTELPAVEDTGSLRLYQYSLNYAHSETDYTEPDNVVDCGMLYIICFSDNSLMLIDSGHGAQATDASLLGLYRFLRGVTGVPEGEKMTVRAWFFSHAHGDHVRLAADFLTASNPDDAGASYSESFRLQTVLFNFPSYRLASNGYAGDDTSALKNAIRRKYPNVDFVKLHRGQQFSIGGATFDVLFTWEDLIKPDGTLDVKKFNSTSTVLKMTYGGKSAIFLGDADTEAEAAMLVRYGARTLRSDIVQVAHHGYNQIQGLYDLIQGDIALVSNSEYHILNNNYTTYLMYSKYASSVLYADDVTWELRFENGEITQTSHPRYDAQE